MAKFDDKYVMELQKDRDKLLLVIGELKKFGSFDECMNDADMVERYGDEETRRKVCASICEGRKKAEEVLMKSLEIQVLNKSSRTFSGWGTVDIVDTTGEKVLLDVVEKLMPIIMERGGAIVDSHSNRIVGRVDKWQMAKHPKTGKDGVYLWGHIFKNYKIDDIVWNAMKGGSYKGLSLGGSTLGKKFDWNEEDGMHALVEKAEIYEWSVVPEPANPFALIEEVNRLAKGGTEMGTEVEKEGGAKGTPEPTLTSEEMLKQILTAVSRMEKALTAGGAPSVVKQEPPAEAPPVEGAAAEVAAAETPAQAVEVVAEAAAEVAEEAVEVAEAAVEAVEAVGGEPPVEEAPAEAIVAEQDEIQKVLNDTLPALVKQKALATLEKMGIKTGTTPRPAVTEKERQGALGQSEKVPTMAELAKMR